MYGTVADIILNIDIAGALYEVSGVNSTEHAPSLKNHISRGKNSRGSGYVWKEGVGSPDTYTVTLVLETKAIADLLYNAWKKAERLNISATGATNNSLSGKKGVISEFPLPKKVDDTAESYVSTVMIECFDMAPKIENGSEDV